MDASTKAVISFDDEDDDDGSSEEGNQKSEFGFPNFWRGGEETPPVPGFTQNLNRGEIEAILKKAITYADSGDVDSQARVAVPGDPPPKPRIRVALLRIQDVHRELTELDFVCPVYTSHTKTGDIPWIGSIDVARSKAFSAVAFSSSQNSLTTRDLEKLSQPGLKGLWGIAHTNTANGIVTFPGGIPLYKEGKLVGGLGVSGDTTAIDEIIAIEAARVLHEGHSFATPRHLLTRTTNARIEAGDTQKSKFVFPAFGDQMITHTLLQAETAVPAKYRRTKMGRRPEKTPEHLGGDKISYEYIMWHHIHLTVMYVVASFFGLEKSMAAAVNALVQQFDEWGAAFQGLSAVVKGRLDDAAAFVSEGVFKDAITWWKKDLILNHTLAAKAVADNTWSPGSATEKIGGLGKITGQNRTDIFTFFDSLLGARSDAANEAKGFWDEHLICTADYVTALHLTHDPQGHIFGLAVFICKLLGLEFGGLLDQVIYGERES